MAGAWRRGWWGLILGAVVILAFLWVGYWYAARYAAETALARVNGAPVNGSEIACANPTLGGFPFVLDIRCARVTYAGPGERLTAALGGVAATAPLYWPGAVAATIDAPLVVNAPAMGIALTTSWSLGTATATANLGGLTGIGASFVSFTADNDGNLPSMPVASLTAAEASASIAPVGGGAYTVRAGARQLRLTRPDGSAFPELDGEARVKILDVGRSLGADPAETLLAWLRRGSTANIERLKIAGVGALVTSDGTLSLSADGLLNGSIALRWNSIEALADLIEALMPGTREEASLPLQGLNALSVPVETADGPLRQTALTFTDGVVWLGIFPLPIDPIPPIRF